MYNIVDFGAVGDSSTMNRRAIQRAVDQCALDGGGTIYIPAGRYVTGTVRLCSNIHLFFEGGAVLLGSTDLAADFEQDEEISYPLYQDTSHSYFHRSLFWAENCDNITFSGMGIIDMQSVWECSNYRNNNRRGAKVIALKECSNVVIQDITIRNATDLGVYLAGCECVRVRGISVESHIDGISPDCCNQVVISDSILRCGDDAIVIKSSYTLNRRKDCENITVAGCVVSSRCNGIKIGTETNGSFRNITITGCSIYNTRFAGIALESVDGGMIDGVTVTGITMQNVDTPLFIFLGDRCRDPEQVTAGKIRNIMIGDITATGPYVPWKAIYEGYTKAEMQESVCITSTITGLPENEIESLVMHHINITVQGGCTPEQKEDIEDHVPEDSKSYPETTRYGRWLPSSGIYMRHIKNLRMDHVVIQTIEEDARPVIFMEDISDLVWDGQKGSVKDYVKI